MRCRLATVLASCLGTCAVGAAEPSWGSVDATTREVKVTLKVDLSHAIAEVAPEFVSFNLDASGFGQIQLGPDPALDLLTSSLRPAQLRVGGTQGDYNVYNVGSGARTCKDLPRPMTDFRCREVSQEQWEELLRFCERNKVGLVFGLNAMFGRPTKEKDPEKPLCGHDACPPMDHSNLESLLRWTAEHYPKGPLIALELGNELNSVLNGKAGARAIAADFHTLAHLRDRIWPSGRRPRLVGPDPHSWSEFDEDGLKWIATFAEAAEGALDAITFHEYALGKGPSLNPHALGESLLNSSALDRSGQGADFVKQAVGSHRGRAVFWAGETAAANVGGAPGITDTFADGFWYLDQLGAHAVRGVAVVQRQVLVTPGSGYPLLSLGDHGKLSVLPDYWLALLHKRLMGQKVLHVSSNHKDFRAYAHCSAGSAGVTVAWLNLGTSSVAASFPAELGGDCEKWLLAPGRAHGAAGPLMSREVRLSGRVLALRGTAGRPELPDLSGEPGSCRVVSLPATAFGFLRFPHAKARACGPAGDEPEANSTFFA